MDDWYKDGCKRCNGSGVKDDETCIGCNGKGTITIVKVPNSQGEPIPVEWDITCLPLPIIHRDFTVLEIGPPINAKSSWIGSFGRVDIGLLDDDCQPDVVVNDEPTE